MAFSKIIMNGETLMDLTQDTVAADKLVKDITAHKNDGTSVTGSYMPPSGSSYTLLSTNEYTVNTTSTSDTALVSINLTANDWTASKIIYVKIRDKAGRRENYFIGTDTFIFNVQAANNSTSSLTNFPRFVLCDNYTVYGTNNSTSFGIYVNSISYSNDVAVVNIYSRYNSSISKTINGTYSVEIYALDYAPNGNPFNYSYA